MIKEEKIEFTARWCKYDKYKIVSYEDKAYIMPDEGAKPSTYDAFDFSNEMLKDILSIAKELSESKEIIYPLKYEILSKDKHFQELTLDFVTKYGLLGMFRYLPESYDFMDDRKLPVRLKGSMTVNSEEFWLKYYCFEPCINCAEGFPEDIDYYKLCGFDHSFKQTEGDRLDDLVFAKKYAEPISELLYFASRIYDHKQLLIAFYQETNEDIKEFYGDCINGSRIKTGEMGYRIQDNKIKFEWKFFSLASIIETMLLLNETNGRNEVKLCKYCGTPFIASNIKAEYDTPQCRNKANIYKSRNKNK